MTKVVEIITYTDRTFEKTPLQFQNFIFSLLDKIKQEKKLLKILKNEKSIAKNIRRDALELLNFNLVVNKESDTKIKIFDEGENHENEGINIELNNDTIKIYQKKSKS